MDKERKAHSFVSHLRTQQAPLPLHDQPNQNFTMNGRRPRLPTHLTAPRHRTTHTVADRANIHHTLNPHTHQREFQNRTPSSPGSVLHRPLTSHNRANPDIHHSRIGALHATDDNISRFSAADPQVKSCKPHVHPPTHVYSRSTVFRREDVCATVCLDIAKHLTLNP